MLGLSYATKGRLYALDLDGVRAVDWLPRVIGQEAFEQIYLPMLSRRFGEYADEISAYAVWHRMSQSLRLGERHLAGFLRGGSLWLENSLQRAIESLGGAVVAHSEINGIEYGRRGTCIEVNGREEYFDALVSTVRASHLAKIAHGRLLKELPATNDAFQSQVTAVAVCNRRSGPYLSADLVDENLPFHLIEETFLAGESGSSSTNRLVYLTRFCGEHTEAYKASEATVSSQARACLERIIPGIRTDDIQDVYVSRTENADPIHSLGYLSRKPSIRIGQTSVFACTAAQAYPKANDWNTSVMLAREVAAHVSRHLD
jgi:protoporphyrinogen oxidase